MFYGSLVVNFNRIYHSLICFFKASNHKESLKKEESEDFTSHHSPFTIRHSLIRFSKASNHKELLKKEESEDFTIHHSPLTY
jgi:hypothetical protein